MLLQMFVFLLCLIVNIYGNGYQTPMGLDLSLRNCVELLLSGNSSHQTKSSAREKEISKTPVSDGFFYSVIMTMVA